MASRLEITPVPEKDLKNLKGVPPAPVIEVKWPKKESSPADARAALKASLEKVAEPKVTENRPVKISAVAITQATLTRLAAVLNSEDGHVEILRQKFDDVTFLSTFYSAFLAHRYMEAQSKIKPSKSGDDGRADLVKAFQAAYATGGLEVTEAELDRFAKQIAGHRDALNAMTKMINAAEVVEQSVAAKGGGGAQFVPVLAKVISPPILIPIPNLCAGPLVQGSFTKHFGGSFSWGWGFYAPCVPKVWKTCWYGFTLSAWYSLDLQVNYQVNCCGASVSGHAVAQACASAMGHTVCISVAANVAAAAGVIKSPGTGGQCNYGLTVVASLTITFAGQTLWSASVPFGYTVTGPCPPPWLNC